MAFARYWLIKSSLIFCFFWINLAWVHAENIDSKPAAMTEEDLVIELREKALQSPLAYNLLESLTSEVGARMAGGPKDALAVEWAVNQLNTLGFDRVWTEPVVFNTWVRGEEVAELLAPYSHQLHVTTLGGSVATPATGLEAEIVEFDSIESLAASAENSAKGKIVFISKQMQASRSGQGYGKTVAARRNGAVEAAKKGAVAVVIRSIGTDQHRLPHTGMMRYQDGVDKIPAAAISNPDADLLQRVLARNQPVKMYLKLIVSQGPQFTSHNVIAEVKGSELADEKIVIGGHLDSWDLGTGAVDDGAGVALTMAAAKIIADAAVRPKRTIRLVLWANEEQGLLGAYAYANQHQNDLVKHIVGAESDFGARKIYAMASKVSEDSLPLVNKIAKLLEPLNIEYMGNQAGPGPDLIPLYNLGMPVFSLEQDGTDYFDLHHTADDTFDKVVAEELAQNVAAYVVFAYLAANSEHKIKPLVQKTK